MHPEHQRLLAELAERRARFLHELSHTDERALRRGPSTGWSLLEVAEHLELVERATLRLLKDPRNATRTLRRRPKNYLGYAALWFVMKTGVRVPVPPPIRSQVTPSGAMDLPRLRTQWSATAAALESHYATLTSSDYRRFVGLHPVGGPFTPTEVLLFLTRHFDHHMRQVRRIRAALDKERPKELRRGRAD